MNLQESKDIQPATMLQSLLEEEYFSPQSEAWLNQHLRTGGSWYGQALLEHGKDVAEAQLNEWEQSRRLHDFARGFQPVVEGLLALAQSGGDTPLVTATTLGGYNTFPSIGDEPIMVAFNTDYRSAAELPGQDDWSPSGQLGLKAVTLQVKHSDRSAQIGLVLPARAVAPGKLNDDAFVVATFNLSGWVRAHRYAPKGFHRDGYLMYSLGMLDLESAMDSVGVSGGHFDEAIGFPGATAYLANALPSLAAYLKAVAAGLKEILTSR